MTCPDCEGGGRDWNDVDPCPRCHGVGQLAVAQFTSDELNRDHLRVSPGGWTCDVCGVAVNGQTDDGGIPLHDGEFVGHTVFPLTQ